MRKTPQRETSGDADPLQVAFAPWIEQAGVLREPLQSPGAREGTPSTGVTSFRDAQHRPPASKLHLGEEGTRAAEVVAQSEDASTAPSQVGVHIDHTIELASRAGSLASQLHLCFTPLDVGSKELPDALQSGSALDDGEGAEPFGMIGGQPTESGTGFSSFQRMFASAKASLQHAVQMQEAAESLGSTLQVEVETREAQVRSRAAHVAAKEQELLAREAEIAAREANADARERAFLERLEAAKLAAEASLSVTRLELSRRLAEVAAREAQLLVGDRMQNTF